MICKDIRIMCKSRGFYSRDKVPRRGFGGGVQWDDIYEGSFDYGVCFACAGPRTFFAYFKHGMHCIGPYWDVDRCTFYVEENGEIIKFEDGEWVESLHETALLCRELLKGPGHFLSEADIESL